MGFGLLDVAVYTPWNAWKIKQFKTTDTSRRSIFVPITMSAIFRYHLFINGR